MLSPRGPVTGQSRPERLLRPVALAACGYVVAAVVWLSFGDTLPGGRWFAVHLFTLGVLSNLVLALSDHFSRTLLGDRRPGRQGWRFAAFNVGALLILGFPPSARYPLAAGALVTTATVIWLGADLDRRRRQARGHPSAFVAEGYLLACAAFVLGAVLGGLLGLRELTGAWYGGGRLAHLHVNVLGWGGLTLLTTVVFLGPEMLGTKAAAGAEARAAGALRAATAGLVVAAAALFLTGTVATWSRGVAAAGLAVYAGAATTICWGVLRTGRPARRSVSADLIRAACVWFAVVVWADAAVFATYRLRILDTLGAALILGVLGQAILAALNHLTPAVWGRDDADRQWLAQRLERFGSARVALLNVGAVLVVGSGVAGRGLGVTGAVLVRGGWLLAAAAVLAHVSTIAEAVARRALAARRA
jgi:hypothetical protein